MNDESAHKGPFEGYGGEDQPLGDYLIGIFHLVFALFLLGWNGIPDLTLQEIDQPRES